MNSMSGAKGGGGGSFTQKPDTLRSNDTFEGLLGLCAGPIKGPVRGLKSVRVNGTPIEGEDGTLNFPAFSALFADGDPLKFPQKVELQLGAAGSPTQVGANIRNHADAGGNPWVTRTLNNSGANSIDLRFIVQSLFRQTAKGIYEDKLNLEIQMKPSGTATWINPFAANGNTVPEYSDAGYKQGKSSGMIGYISQVAHLDNQQRVSNPTAAQLYLKIAGKTTSPYVHELRIQVPNSGNYANKTWDIRIRLLEAESFESPEGTKEENKITEKRLIQWESMAAVYSEGFGDHEDWRGLSWLQIFGKATDNLNGLPDVDGIYDTKIVSVPNIAVYDPETRVYSGAIWDGSWSKFYCNDPAWVINDAVSDAISGIAAFVPGAHLNKWDALELSKWASQLVPNGAGGLHPRYSMNLYVDQPQKADEFIRYLAGAVGATTWDNGDGEWRIKVDKPEAPTNIFTHENIEGEFFYSHTDVDTRFNDITVVFLNEEFDFAEDRVRVQDFPDIDLNGRKPTRVVAIGCTNRQQALRLAVLRLRTNINEKRMVTFQTNRQGKYLERFDHILIADGSLGAMPDGSARNTTGRIVLQEAGGLTVTVRDPVRLEIGAAYELVFTIPNPAYTPDPTSQPIDPTWNQPTVTIRREIINTAAQRGDVTQLILRQAVPADMPENAVVALSAPGLPTLPKIFRVLDVGYDDDGERVSINAMEVDTGKWYAADNVIESEVTIKPVGATPAPRHAIDGSMFHLDNYFTDAGQRRVLTIRWERPPGRYTTSYNVCYRVNGGSWLLLDQTPDTSVELHYPDAGIYEVEVTANDRRGLVSLPLKGSYELQDETLTVPPAVGLTNEATLLYADAQGNVVDYSDAVGRFFVVGPAGDITEGVSFYVKPGSATGGLTVSLDEAGAYVVTGLTADSGSITLVAEVANFVFEKVLTVVKSKSARGIAVMTDLQAVPFTPASQPVTPAGVITFRAERKNTVQPVSWTMTKLDGSTVSNGVTLTVSSDTLIATLTHANFAGARGTQEGVVITATCDGFSDRVSVVRVQSGAPGLPGEPGTPGEPGAPGAPGAPAKAMRVLTNRRTVTYNGNGFPDPAEQSIMLTAQRANTTAAITWSVTDINGVARTPLANFLSGTTGDNVTMTEAQFAAARNGTFGVIIKATLSDGVEITDQVDIIRVQAGATGASGSGATELVTARLTKDSARIFAYADGNPASYEGAVTNIEVNRGNSDVTIYFYIEVSNNPLGLNYIIDAQGKKLTVFGGFPPGENIAPITVRIIGTDIFAGQVLYRTFTVEKLKTGYEIVSSEPTTNLFEGREIFDTSVRKRKTYKFGLGWRPVIDVDSAIAAAMIEGELGYEQMKKLLIGDFSNLAVNGDLNTGTLEGWSRNFAPPGNGTNSEIKVLTAPSNFNWPATYGLRLYRAPGDDAERTIVNGMTSWDSGGLRDGIALDNGDEVQVELVGWTDGPGVSFFADMILKRNYGVESIVNMTPEAIQNCYPIGIRIGSNVGQAYAPVKFAFKNNSGSDGRAWLRLWAPDGDMPGQAVVWNVRILRRNAAALVVQGGIQAHHMAVDSVDTNALRAGAVTAAELAATNLITLSAQINQALINNGHIQNLSVDTLKIAGGSIMVPYVTEAADVYVGMGWDAPVAETGAVTVGDGVYGTAFVMVFCEMDTQNLSDCAVILYLETNKNGQGWVSETYVNAGVATNGANTRARLPISACMTVSGVSTLAVRMRAVSTTLPVGGGNPFYIRRPTIVIMGGKR